MECNDNLRFTFSDIYIHFQSLNNHHNRHSTSLMASRLHVEKISVWMDIAFALNENIQITAVKVWSV